MGNLTLVTSRDEESWKDVVARVQKKIKERANETGKEQWELLPKDIQEVSGIESLSAVPDVEIWKRNGIPIKYQPVNFGDFRGNDEMVKKVKEYLLTTSDMIFMGKTGSGKTHLAISCLKEIHTERARFITAPELLLEIRASFNGGQKGTEQEIIERYCSCPVLVLDDLGAEKSSDYSITTLYLIIDRRMRNCKRTIITTNLTLEEIEKNLDARIASRLAGMKIIKINMPDYRKKR